MTIFGVDVHPVYQANLNIDQVAKEGFSWLTVKASQGTNTKWATAAKAWCDRGEAAGMVAFPYHYLDAGNIDAQAKAAKTAAAGRPIMLDVENGSGTVDGDLHPFLAACARIGQPVCLVYLPQWYWSQIGKPNLAGLPPLVASHYGSATGYASSIYTSVSDSWWSNYGNGQVAVLQFTDKASVAGQKVDANAYRGSLDEFRALVHSAPVTPPPAPTYPTLRLGDTSTLVWNLQVFLNRAFPAYSKIDAGPGPSSLFGPVTKSTVTEFQRRSGLTADGVVGPATWTELGKLGFHP